MKNRHIKLVVLITLVTTIGAVSSFAQCRPGNAHCMKQRPMPEKFCNQIPDLSEDQKTEIDALRNAHIEKVNLLKLDVQELNIQLKRLEMADKPDQKAVNDKIDEIYVKKAAIEKERSTHRNAVQALLTPEQILAFNAHHQRMGHHKMQGCTDKPGRSR